MRSSRSRRASSWAPVASSPATAGDIVRHLGKLRRAIHHGLQGILTEHVVQDEDGVLERLHLGVVERPEGIEVRGADPARDAGLEGDHGKPEELPSTVQHTVDEFAIGPGGLDIAPLGPNQGLGGVEPLPGPEHPTMHRIRRRTRGRGILEEVGEGEDERVPQASGVAGHPAGVGARPLHGECDVHRDPSLRVALMIVVEGHHPEHGRPAHTEPEGLGAQVDTSLQRRRVLDGLPQRVRGELVSHHQLEEDLLDPVVVIGSPGQSDGLVDRHRDLVGLHRDHRRPILLEHDGELVRLSGLEPRPAQPKAPDAARLHPEAPREIPTLTNLQGPLWPVVHLEGGCAHRRRGPRPDVDHCARRGMHRAVGVGHFPRIQPGVLGVDVAKHDIAHEQIAHRDLDPPVVRPGHAALQERPGRIEGPESDPLDVERAGRNQYDGDGGAPTGAAPRVHVAGAEGGDLGSRPSGRPSEQRRRGRGRRVGEQPPVDDRAEPASEGGAASLDEACLSTEVRGPPPTRAEREGGQDEEHEERGRCPDRSHDRSTPPQGHEENRRAERHRERRRHTQDHLREDQPTLPGACGRQESANGVEIGAHALAHSPVVTGRASRRHH